MDESNVVVDDLHAIFAAPPTQGGIKHACIRTNDTDRARRNSMEDIEDTVNIIQRDRAKNTDIVIGSKNDGSGESTIRVMIRRGVHEKTLAQLQLIPGVRVVTSEQSSLQRDWVLLGENEEVTSMSVAHETLPVIPLLQCIVCGKTSTSDVGDIVMKKCGKCMNVIYCGVECQRADYSKHKNICGETARV
jgi:MYND finger